MQRFKRLLYRLLFPGKLIIFLGVPVSAALLTYTFMIGSENSVIAYISYVLSAYMLTVVCINLVPVMRGAKNLVYKNPYIGRYMKDLPYKLRVSLHLSLVINLLYAGVNAFSGFYYHSVWFGTLSAYYIFLSVMRFLLVRYAHKSGFGENAAAELKRYRACGFILIVMNIALAGVVVLVLRQNRGFEYAGSLIYIMAMYAFYTTIMAIINLVRYKKYNSPVMSAARAVNLAAALVSMLSLETAMLTQFDDGSTSLYFREVMIGFTGGAVCAAIVGMGIFMAVSSSRRLKRLDTGVQN